MSETHTRQLSDFFAGFGSAAELWRGLDWGLTPFGDPQDWSATLKQSITLISMSPVPMLLCWGKDFLQLPNAAFLEVFGKDRVGASLGRPAGETFFEVWATLHPLLEAATRGEPGIQVLDLPFGFSLAEGVKQVEFSCSPVRDLDGSGVGVLIVSRVLAEQSDGESLKMYQLNLRKIISGASAGICVLRGEDLRVEEVNEEFLRIVGRSRRAFVGKALWKVLAELAKDERPFTDQVWQSGLPYKVKEHEIKINRLGRLEKIYLDLVYEPVKDRRGKVEAIFVTAMEVTEKVLDRKGLEAALEKIRLSKEAAQLGTFDMDLKKGTMDWDERCRTLFGISHQAEVTYEKDFLMGLHPEDKDRILEVISGVFLKSVSNGDYDVEYRTVGVDDGQVRWVRAKGKAYFNEQEEPVRFIGSVLDITDQKTEEMRKNDFIGMVSHELKTPLTSLLAYVQLLERTISAQGPAGEVLRKCEMQIRKMGNMITGFLNISRLEAGKSELNLSRFDLAALLHETAVDMQMVNPAYQFDCSDEGEAWIEADQEKISSVVSNLLNNAVKYSPKGSLVKVDYLIKDEQVVVMVKDWGIGISPDESAHIFERFYRVNSKQTQTMAGFGIGLYLSAEFIRMHQGKIWLARHEEGGSVFSFSLPHSALTAHSQ